MFKDTWDALDTILTTLIATTTLNNVTNYDLKQYTGFPCITISPVDWGEVFSDTANNEDNFKMRVRVVDQNKSIATMEPRIRLLVDQIIAELRKKDNAELWNTICSFTMTFVWGWLDDQFPTRICDIIIEAKQINATN